LNALRTLAIAAVVVALAGCKRAPTFARDVAPIVYARCAPCHRAGGAGPFPLTSYEEVRRRATQIARVTARRYMPPWKAAPLDGVRYLGERRLSDAEIATLGRWAEAGAPLGDAARAPASPAFADGWALGTPDVIVTLPAYALAAGGRDDYRNFVVHEPVADARWVAAWELRPNGRAIHHAIVNVDRNRLARKRDGADGKPGYAGMEPGDVQSPDGFYLVWTPGQAPTPPQPGQAWRLDAATDLVVQLHMQPTGKPETVQPSLGLWLTASPPTVPRLTLRIGDRPIDIAPGARFTMRDEITLPVAVELLALFPHLHYLGRGVRVWAALPGGRTQPLLAIDDWDPAWQDKYTLATPLALPAGTTLAMELSYDNSSANPRNPNVPPARVQTGERTVDEMGNVTFELRLAGEADKTRLRESKYRRQLERGGDVDARVHYNLGNTLADQQRWSEAAAAYRRALALQPSLLPAEVNLGRALLAVGDVDGAVRAYEAAVKLEPGNEKIRALLNAARSRSRPRRAPAAGRGRRRGRRRRPRARASSPPDARARRR
jgi:tetratricopeptide repeat protein